MPGQAVEQVIGLVDWYANEIGGKKLHKQADMAVAGIKRVLEEIRPPEAPPQ